MYFLITLNILYFHSISKQIFDYRFVNNVLITFKKIFFYKIYNFFINEISNLN